MAADWIGIGSSHLLAGGAGVGFCGDETGQHLADALDGTDFWRHAVDEIHWFIINLGVTYDVQKVRARSNTDYDPTDVNIYVSDDPENWGEAVASGISTWQNRTDWDTDAIIDVTDKEGQYVKIEIIDTEYVGNHIIFGQGTPFTIFDVYGEAVAPPPAEDVAVFMGANF